MPTIRRGKQQRSIRLDMLNTEARRAVEAARRPGGVSVVDAHGTVRFQLSIPSTPLPK
jgi:hypothetical protein